jgi:outer membrane protein, multidrug efflux system
MKPTVEFSGKRSSQVEQAPRIVAQVGNLLFRRLAVGGATVVSTARGLPIRDTADCQSALRWRGVFAVVLAAFAVGCTTVGPDYERPKTEVPPAFKSTNDLGAWKEGQPLDHAAKGAWWEVFGDATLNDLEQRATTANQQLKAAVARVEQARATARLRKGDLQPTLESNSFIRKERYSPNQQPSFGAITATTIRVPLDLSYEVDLWGRLQRGFESARADAQASLAALHQIQLVVQADVAQNYFTLRALDAEIATVVSTIGLRKEQLQLVRSRFEGGVASELDVARAQTELAAAEAEHAALARQRAELENALAVLLGEPASAFKLPALASAHTTWQPLPPSIPAGLPADCWSAAQTWPRPSASLRPRTPASASRSPRSSPCCGSPAPAAS